MNIEQQILEWVHNTWKPDVVLIGGSRATLEHSPASDWDLYLLGPYANRTSWAGIFCGENIDIELVPTSTISDRVLRVSERPVRALRVLSDKTDGLGESLVALTAEAFKQGPSSLPEEVRVRQKAEMIRLADKLVVHGADPEACFATLAAFHTIALQSWCELTGRWPAAPYRVLPLIRAKDPAFSAALAIIASGQTIDEKIVACTKITSLLWENFTNSRQ